MSLESRLFRLERRFGLLMSLCATQLAAIAVILLVGQGKPANKAIVEAQKFVLKDRMGKELGFWGELQSGAPALYMRGAVDVPQSIRLVGGDKPRLALVGAKASMELLVSRTGLCSYSWYRKSKGRDEDQFTLVMTNLGYPSMSFYGKDGKVIESLPRD